MSIYRKYRGEIEFLVAVSIALFIAFMFFSFGVGISGGAYLDKEERCEYNSILTRFNPAYFIGCELTEPRYE